MKLPAPVLAAPPDDPALKEPVRGFVSWYLDGALVGCIGLVESQMPLLDFVSRFALQAGTADRRTPDLRAEQVPRLDFELHLLGESEPLCGEDGQRALGLRAIAEALEVGKDGLWLTHPGGARAFFLPSVWEQLPRADAFVLALARKAGLDPSSGECDQCRGAVLRAWTLHDRG
jgi:AmmeMemoRadiSam system protein A